MFVAEQQLTSLSPLGFEFSLFTEFKRVVRRCLTAPRSGALVLSSTRHSAIEMKICIFVYLNY